ncbi:DapH/DapD/GlmU-related protein [Cupriavidus numazuensis]|uniref:UDP-3-O-(3-hydroxymyristoyl)glucosamine N-acyltransferase n=1 Tax=Cupriavidus numazuensis TaxID=221992 RepID=A0ABM8TRB3_9BURK|nr:DapH/DapD/GlmU-related protein [Cupriavidus numazuensis]CAG2158749.1 UDP-3-O-(3-hydroxymyristoyl)glucosamine N-acyltransferase [Cupriavidus numazuensis]
MPLIHSSPISSVVIAGAGGFGIELYDYLNEEALRGGPAVAGFLVDPQWSTTIPEGIDKPYLGAIGDFRAESGQVAVVAIGTAQGRQSVLAQLSANGVATPTYVHGTAIVSPAARLGHGVIICPFSIVNRDAAMADGSVANVHCSIGHNASVGEYSILSPYAALNGYAAIGARCFLGTRATIYPRVHIGDDCIVDTHAGVRANTGDKVLISSRGTYQVSPLRTR